MFGALGFHAGDRFFAVGDVEEGAIYLKVDELTRGRFEAAGGRPFTYPARDGSLMVMSYLTPPDAALEDPEAMLPWALLALEAAERAQARKAKPASRAKPASKPRPAPKARVARKGRVAPKARPAPRRPRGGVTRRATRRG
jgi:DNA transformation protein and related proteins